jgi:hypothetical protein
VPFTARAAPYYAAQTILSQGQDLLAYYADLLVKDAFNLLSVSQYVAVDAYFSKKSFIDSVSEVGLYVITRMRDDAVLYYAYTGTQSTGRGRKKQFAGKIEVKNLDLSLFRACIQEDTWTAFEGIAYAKALKKWVKTVVVQHYNTDDSIKKCKIFIATDLAITGADLYLYYHLRFQIERFAVAICV